MKCWKYDAIEASKFFLFLNSKKISYDQICGVYPGRDHQGDHTRGKDIFREKGGGTFFEIIRGSKNFFRENREDEFFFRKKLGGGAETFFNTKF